MSNRAGDIVAARHGLIESLAEKPATIEDWPDLLALDLLTEPDLPLSAWAARHGLHPGSLSRGFRQQFDISPAGFRTAVRARRAIEHIATTRASLSAIASEQGFSDQAHMTRSIRHMTSHSPHALRQHLHGQYDEALA
jgi:AraC-like DNA-binding protein